MKSLDFELHHIRLLEIFENSYRENSNTPIQGDDCFLNKNKEALNYFQLQLSQVIETVEYEQFGKLKSRKLRYLREKLETAPPLQLDGVQMASVSSADNQLPIYDLTEIPPITVWLADKCELLIDWKAYPDEIPSFSIKTSPKPNGNISLEQLSEGNATWHFQYIPNENDKFPFTVTITATIANGQTQSTSFEITPMQELPTEEVVFDKEGYSQSVPMNIEKPQCTITKQIYTELPSKPLPCFNYKIPEDSVLILRKIRIVAETIVFDKMNDEFGIYSRFNNKDDIQELELIAETLIIHSTLCFPQTNVTIYANQLCFEGADGQIKTTPLTSTRRLETSEDGDMGLDAGNINLNIETLVDDNASDQLIRFDLTGGNGQNGGDGRNGEKGKDLPSEGEDYDTILNNGKETKIYKQGYKIVRVFQYCVGFPMPSLDQFPENDVVSAGYNDGNKASPPGHPGEPGKAGVINTTFDVKLKSKIAGGLCGKLPEQRIYYAGQPGHPKNWFKIYKYYFLIGNDYKVAESYEGKYGGKDIDTSLYQAKKAIGDMGQHNINENLYAWLHPSLLNMVLIRSKNYYLGNCFDKASSLLEKYVGLLDGYKETHFWESIDEVDKLEYSQIYTEMNGLIHRMARNLDYFENPAGWVPLLSFEINQEMYKVEIERSIGILYTVYFIRNSTTDKETWNAMISLRSQLESDLKEYLVEYDKKYGELVEKEKEFKHLEDKSVDLQNVLVKLEDHYEKVYEFNKELINSIKVTGKIAGTLISVIPVGQPATGIIGQGVSVLAGIDFSKPLESVLDGVDILAKYAKTGFTDKAKKAKEDLGKAKISTEKQKKIDNYTDLAKSGSNLTDGIKDIKSFLKTNSASQSEVDAAVAKIAATSPEYQKFSNDLSSLLVEKQKVADIISEYTDTISTLYNSASRCLSTLDSISESVESLQQGLDPRLISYFDGLEREAYDRLLVYHYYLAKSYEYRLLIPYTKPLDLEEISKRLQSAVCAQIFNMDDFKTTINSFFTDILSRIATSIYTERQKEYSNIILYQLSDNEVSILNDGGAIEVDFSKFISDEENLRLTNIEILMNSGTIGIETEYDGDKETDYIDLIIEHPEVSKLRSNSDIYKFVHPYQNDKNPYTWKIRYLPKENIVQPSKQSSAEGSLLKSLLNGKASEDLLLYSRASAWSKLQIKMTNNITEGDRSIKLKMLKLKLSYDYSLKTETDVDIEVVTTIIQSSESNKIEVVENSMQPYFIIDKADINKRQDARGSFLRIYNSKIVDCITVTAQPTYGSVVFNKWTDINGVVLEKNQAIKLQLNKKRIICAQYIAIEDSFSPMADIVSAIPKAQQIGNALMVD